MYMPLTIVSIRLPKIAGMRPLNSIGAGEDCSFIFAAIASTMSTSKPTSFPSCIDSKGGNVAAMPQVSLPLSIKGSVCARDTGARREETVSARDSVATRINMHVSKDDREIRQSACHMRAKSLGRLAARLGNCLSCRHRGDAEEERA